MSSYSPAQSTQNLEKPILFCLAIGFIGVALLGAFKGGEYSSQQDVSHQTQTLSVSS